MVESMFYKSIEDYINTPITDYAIMISGEWGIGKTYFLKNTLLSDFKEKNKRCIYISFIGRNDETKLKDDIYKKINPFYFSENKSKVLLEAEAIEEIVNNGLKKNIPEDIILCFDDLERINKDFFEPAMGLINVFIEHYNVKTLFICNERKLENIIPKYKEIKEKYIRFTYEFNPELKEILNSIIQGGKYKNISDFIDKDVVVDVFKRGKSKNIRTLFFVLDVFAKIKYLLDDYKESDSYNDLKTLVLHYICFYSIERKQRGIDALILSKISISFFNPHISFSRYF